MKKRESVGVIYTNGGKFLAVISSINKKIGLPKGMRDNGETTEQTAVREFGEEVGIRLDKNNLVKLGKFEYSNIKDLVLFKYKTDMILPISSFRCDSVFSPFQNYPNMGFKKELKLPEIESYKYIDIDSYTQLHTNYHNIFKKIKDNLK